MKTENLLVQIFLDSDLKKSDLDLRHILVDTVECRNLGEVVEVTSSREVLEVIIEHPANKKIEDEIKSFLICLGFNNYEMEYIGDTRFS